MADSWNHRIQKFDSRGNHLQTFGSSGEGKGELNEPYDIMVEDFGNILVVERYNHRLQWFSTEGKSLGWIGQRGTVLEEHLAYFYETPANLFSSPAFEFPTSVGTDSLGNYFITDSGITASSSSIKIGKEYLHLVNVEKKLDNFNTLFASPLEKMTFSM